MRDLVRFLAEQTGETILAVDPERMGAEPREPAAGGAGVAVVGVHGPLIPRSLNFGFFGRIPGMDAIRAQLAQAAADPNIGAIVLDVNSPGGTYAGTPETAAAVRAANEVKPVIAVVDVLAASAAYFIAAQAREIAITPSGEAGSIGVLSLHLDFSRQLEQDGVTPTIIRSRPSKADANPFEPLTDEARAAIQASVMEADEEFLKAVAKGRGMTLAKTRQLVDDNGLGRVVSAKQAVSLGLADRVATMGEVLSGLIKKPAPRRRSALAFL